MNTPTREEIRKAWYDSISPTHHVESSGASWHDCSECALIAALDIADALDRELAETKESYARCFKAFEERRAERDEARRELAELRFFIERRGYRRCDIPACNCGSFHGGHAEDLLAEIHAALGELVQGRTALQAVEHLRARLAAKHDQGSSSP